MDHDVVVTQTRGNQFALSLLLASLAIGFGFAFWHFRLYFPAVSFVSTVEALHMAGIALYFFVVAPRYTTNALSKLRGSSVLLAIAGLADAIIVQVALATGRGPGSEWAIFTLVRTAASATCFVAAILALSAAVDGYRK